MRCTAVGHSANRGGVEEMGKVAGPLLSVTVSPDVLKRADRLIPTVGRDSAVTSIGCVTRSTVVNLALMRGLEALEREYA
jgi:hypothetical protein